MEIRTRVVVYGSSLSMAGIAASLKAEQSLEVVCVDPYSPIARQTLGEPNPAAIAFDLSDPPASLDVTLLRQKPGMLLIGIDPASDEILVLSGYPQQALSVSDLVHVIQQKSSSIELLERRKQNEKPTCSQPATFLDHPGPGARPAGGQRHLGTGPT